MVEIEEQRMILRSGERAALNSNLLQAIASIPKGSAVAYDFGVIAKKGDLLGLNLPVPSITSWRAEIDGNRFSGMNEVDGSFWAISLKAGSASG